MTNRFLLIAISILFFLPVFISCEPSTESKDNEPPRISSVAVNIMDTIELLGSSILLNKDSLSDNRIDTIVLGHRLTLSARFSDNESLSSYKIVLDTMPENKGNYPEDTVFYAKRGWAIFSPKGILKDTIVSRQNDILIPDSIQGMRKDTLRTYPVREGDYYLNVYCLDRAGNESSVKHRVRLLRRSTILKNR